MKVTIVGGSLVGPALALMLQGCGIDAEVYEAAAETVPQAGGVIGVDMQSLTALDNIGICQEDVIPFSSERVINVTVRDRTEKGRAVTVWPGRHATWTLLHKALRAKMPDGTFHGGQRVVALSIGDDQRARVHFEGSTVDTDLVVFADGRRSTGRKLLDPGRKLRYAGFIGHRGWSDEAPPVIDYTRWQMERTEFHTAPIVTGTGTTGTDWTYYSHLSADQFKQWFGSVPERKTFVLPYQMTPAARADADRLAERHLPVELAQLVEGTTTRLLSPIVDIDEPTRMVWPVGRSHAVLIGDALAPVRPSTARGLNNGLDQAAGLMAVLGQVANHSADLEACLTGWGGFQDRYLPRVLETLHTAPRALIGMNVE